MFCVQCNAMAIYKEKKYDKILYVRLRAVSYIHPNSVGYITLVIYSILQSM